MKKFLLLVAVVFSVISIYAQGSKPTFYSFINTTTSIVTRLSDNGQWCITATANQDVEAKPQLMDVLTHKLTDLISDADFKAGHVLVANDVTDDGNIVVGQLDGNPGYVTVKDKKFHPLPVTSGYVGGFVASVTPDGRLAVGALAVEDNEYQNEYAMWDLTTGQLVSLPNLPIKNLAGGDDKQRKLMEISADGTKVLGCVSWSYLPVGNTVECGVFVYDIAAKDYVMVGFNKIADGRYTAVEGVFFVDGYSTQMSPNGEWVVGPDEDQLVRYNTRTKTYDFLGRNNTEPGLPAAILNDGTVLAAVPTDVPMRHWGVYLGDDDEYYSISTVMQQIYGINIPATTGYEYTGTPMSVSADGLTLALMCDPQSAESYLLTLPTSLRSLCQGVNLLGSYAASPREGVALSAIKELTLVFEQDIKIVGSYTDVKLNKAGAFVRNPLADGGFEVMPQNKKMLKLSFRSVSCDDGTEYTVVIPAGTIAMANNPSRTNDEIVLRYTGRGNRPVQLLGISPADGSSLPTLDASGSSIVLDFDCDVRANDDAKAALYREEDDTKVCELVVGYNGKQIGLFPAVAQPLYNEVKYYVRLEAGSVSDLGGSNASKSEEITIHYTGSYIRQIIGDETTLFADDFNNPANSQADWLLYEGDHLTPNAEMEGWGFDADNNPWNFSVRDNEESLDYCAASTSMYVPAGKSDDWMVTPQLFIPDGKCSLSFDAQSYMAMKEDKLKIIVWASEEPVNFLTAPVVEKMRTQGVVLGEETLNVGKDASLLAGDWTHYQYSLAPFEGKSVYIAFVNENNNQSAIFVDNVLVSHDVHYLLSLTTPESVVTQESVKVAGRLTANSEGVTYQNVTLTLKDSDGLALSTISKTGANLSKGSTLDFAFDKELPLVANEKNTYYIDVKLDDYTNIQKCSINNLAFQTTKRIVLEEQTGQTCQFCPLGHLGVDKLTEVFGSQFLPVAIHTYDGRFDSGHLTGYAAYVFNNSTAAPIANINRQGTLASPMYHDGKNYQFSAPDGSAWLDIATQEMERNTLVDISATATYESNDPHALTVTADVTAAMNLQDVNYNVFMILTEDKLTGVQVNGVCNNEDANLGIWGKGGLYGKQAVTGVTHNNVCRQYYGQGYNGTPSLLPSALSANQAAQVTLQAEVPNLQDLVVDNCQMTVVLIDANTGRVENACRVPVQDRTGVSGIVADSPADAPRYNLAGQRVSEGYRGLIIRNGKKYISK